VPLVSRIGRQADGVAAVDDVVGRSQREVRADAEVSVGGGRRGGERPVITSTAEIMRRWRSIDSAKRRLLMRRSTS
jgi:hypothetical protein